MPPREHDPSPDENCRAVREAAAREPYARRMGIRCTEVRPGFCRVELVTTPDMDNLFGLTHGGAVFSLIDEAFQIAGNTDGVAAFALNLSVTYVAPSRAGDRLVAEAREVARTRKTATYEVRVTREGGGTVAVAQALAYRKGGRPPFLPEPVAKG